MLESTQALMSLGMPFKNLLASFMAFSKFKHFSQQLCLKGIFPFNFTNLDLCLYKVDNETFLVVESSKLYILWHLFMLNLMNLFPAYFLSGSGNKLSSDNIWSCISEIWSLFNFLLYNLLLLLDIFLPTLQYLLNWVQEKLVLLQKCHNDLYFILMSCTHFLSFCIFFVGMMFAYLQ